MNPWYLVAAGIVFVFIYSLGQHGSSRHKDLFKFAGVFGTGTILLKFFWSYCPGVATYYLFIILIISSILSLVVWLFYRDNNSKIANCNNSVKPEFNHNNDTIYKKAGWENSTDKTGRHE